MAGLAYGPEPSRPINEQELVQQLSLSVNHTGADVRITTGQILSHKPPNHASVRVWWWQWKQLFNVKSNEVSHVNVLDMNMILLTLLWRCCNPRCVNLHLEDSLVSRLIVCKGRTSSALWQPLCNRDENPTGAASRLQSVAAPPMPRTLPRVVLAGGTRGDRRKASRDQPQIAVNHPEDPSTIRISSWSYPSLSGGPGR